MILNIVTNSPRWVLEDLEAALQPYWNVEYYRNVADNIHEYKLTPVNGGVCLSVSALLETGLNSWDIRICEYGTDNKK